MPFRTGRNEDSTAKGREHTPEYVMMPYIVPLSEKLLLAYG
jgi:hypothetical protein